MKREVEEAIYKIRTCEIYGEELDYLSDADEDCIKDDMFDLIESVKDFNWKVSDLIDVVESFIGDLESLMGL